MIAICFFDYRLQHLFVQPQIRTSFFTGDFHPLAAATAALGRRSGGRTSLSARRRCGSACLVPAVHPPPHFELFSAPISCASLCSPFVTSLLVTRNHIYFPAVAGADQTECQFWKPFGSVAYTVGSKSGESTRKFKIMSKHDSAVRDISDTARWVAYFRARETQRPDALFRDPYAERLAGQRGFQVANSLQDGTKQEWAWAARIYLFDRFVGAQVRAGAELIVNLAAGLDTRPYRLELPPTLQWVEVDLPQVISYKQEVLKREKPVCLLEQIPLDLTDVLSRRKLFQELNDRKKKVCVMTEGLLVYLTAEEVASLARDLARDLDAQNWLIDLCSPGQLKIMQRTYGKQLGEAGAALRFAPEEGPAFFLPHGWQPIELHGFLKTAASLNRAPAALLSLLPEPDRIQGNYPWTGICLLKKC